MKNELVKNGVDEKKIEIIHNWSDGKAIYPLDKRDNPFIKQHNLENKFIVLYSGNMTIVHEFNSIKTAMAKLRDKKDIVFPERTGTNRERTGTNSERTERTGSERTGSGLLFC